LTGYILLLK